MGLPGTVHMHAACTKHRYGVSKLLKKINIFCCSQLLLVTLGEGKGWVLCQIAQVVVQVV